MLVLFGGKGAGKSTFIKRLLHHQQPPWLRENTVSAIIDLLKVPEQREAIGREIWGQLVKALDQDDLLSQSRETLLKELFSDRYKIAEKQELAGLNPTSEAYNIRLNALLSDWKVDKIYCAQQLTSYWKRRSKGVIVVVDNTDQYSGDVQDYCFTTAQQVSAQLRCVTLISMREERFFNSKIHGVLDAFQNSGFHVSSPKPSDVFRKRLNYVISLLRDDRKREDLTQDADHIVDDAIRYLEIVEKEFRSEGSPLTRFLSACAHGDTRLSLDLFRSFLLSGYTNVQEMLAVGTWTFKIHQVIKPVMVPTRYFYAEKLSEIPNIYQLRNVRHSSHFTSLRVLEVLFKAIGAKGAAYVSIAQLKSQFSERFQMYDDLIQCLDVLLKSGCIESGNRLDEYNESVDDVKITSYGQYIFNSLAFDFTYIDLVSLDCGIFDEQISNYLSEAAKNEYTQFSRNERLRRVQIRVDRVDKFISYLVDEERRENELYGLNLPEDLWFSSRARAAFDKEREAILQSARKQQNKSQRS